MAVICLFYNRYAAAPLVPIKPKTPLFSIEKERSSTAIFSPKLLVICSTVKAICRPPSVVHNDRRAAAGRTLRLGQRKRDGSGAVRKRNGIPAEATIC